MIAAAAIQILLHSLAGQGSVTTVPSTIHSVTPSYRIIIEGFKIDHEYRDGLLDAGDSVFVNCLITRYTNQGYGATKMVETPVIGWSLNRRSSYKGGTKTGDGGFKAGDLVPASLMREFPRPSLPGHTPVYPMLVDTETVGPGDALLFIPTIWHADGVDRGKSYEPVMSYLRGISEASFFTIQTQFGSNNPDWFWSFPGIVEEGGLRTYRGLRIGAHGENDNPYGWIETSNPDYKYFSPASLILRPVMLETILRGDSRGWSGQSWGMNLIAPGELRFDYTDMAANSIGKSKAELYIRIERA